MRAFFSGMIDGILIVGIPGMIFLSIYATMVYLARNP
jgi:hypothetical protein